MVFMDENFYVYFIFYAGEQFDVLEMSGYYLFWSLNFKIDRYLVMLLISSTSKNMGNNLSAKVVN